MLYCIAACRARKFHYNNSNGLWYNNGRKARTYGTFKQNIHLTINKTIIS